MIGQTILHYKILAKLGEGGMGVVYKAEDTKLERVVALKFLPTNTLTGEEEKKRFKREAKAAAALNHPNICHIYAIDEADDLLFIAMEFIEGKSLAEMVGANGGSPLQIPDAINYATQIAAGLQAAHEKGITHRDIKSANIMVTDKGVVKIMDFGLAKLGNRSMMTKEGTTLGTAAYMSPEQARGEIVDQRTDIWSLGVVLYEMISGRLPFRGEYEQAMMYSILNEDLEPLTALRTGVPIALDGILAKALAKDREIRYQHVDELPADLKAIELASVSRSRISGQTIPLGAATKPRASPAPLPRIVAAACFLVALTALALLYLRRPPVQATTIRSFIPLPEKSTFTSQFGFGKHLALSPDGSKLAFTATDSSGRTRLWVRPLDALSAHALAGTESASDPFWSPDNRSIGFFANNQLKKIEAAGGPALTICEAFEARGGAWNKDDMIIFAPTASGPLYLVPAAGGAATAVTKLDTARKELAHRWPGFLPDGKHFIYFAQASGAPNAIFAASLDMKVNKLLAPATSNVAYASGYLLFHRNGTLVAQRLEASALALKGDAIPVAEQVRYDVAFTDLASFTVSENGILAYRSGVRQPGSKLLIFDREGKPIGSAGELDNYMGVRLSPDGQRVAADILDSQSRQYDIWLFELARGIKTRFTFDPASDRFPVWSPDGNRLVFHNSRKGVFDLYQKTASGAGSEELLFESKENKQPFDWSRDGRFITYITYGDPKTRADIWVLPRFGDRKPIPFVQTEADELYPCFSPDGGWMAYASDESRQLEVYVRQFIPTVAAEQSRDSKWQISNAGGTRPRWRRDGKELFYLSNDNKIMAVAIKTTASTIEVGAVRPLFQTQAATMANNYDVSGDGQRFIVNSLVESQASAAITLVVNWPEALKKR
jgi:eukaryotic-like serine/threonine-protein kinase